jgi:type I restriction enzyme S subunit
VSAVLEEAPRTLPASWHWTTMSEIADVVGGGTPRTNDPTNYEGGDVPWITPADLSGYTEKHISHGARFITRKGLESSSARLLPAGTVLFTSRAPIGYVAIARNPVATNQGFKSFVLKDGVLPEYVYWWLKGSKQRAEALASGTTFLELSGANAKRIPIPLAPLEQQRRIVAEIEKQFSRLDEAVANLKRVKANLKRYKAAVLKAAVEGRLVPTEAELARREGRSYETATQLLQRILETRRRQWKGKGKYKQPDWTEIVRPSQLPEGWSTCGIDQIVPATREALKTGPFGSLLKKHEHRSHGVPVLGIENIGAMRFIRGTKISITVEKAMQLRDYEVRPGDMLVSRSGTVGEVCVVPHDIGDARISTNLLRVRLASSGMLPEFFVLLFNGSPFVLDQVADLCKGSTRDFLNQSILKRLCFVLPPLAEQRRILAEVDRCLSLVRELETEVDANLNRAKGLRQAVLRKVFSVGSSQTAQTQSSSAQNGC